jgi:hypothetical protein
VNVPKQEEEILHVLKDIQKRLDKIEADIKANKK